MTVKRGGVAVYQKSDFDPKQNFVAKQAFEGRVSGQSTTTVAKYTRDDFKHSQTMKNLCD